MAAPKKLAFSTLLKLLQLSELQRQSQLKRRLKGGGYSFWRPLESLAQKTLVPGADIEALLVEIEQNSSEVQGKYNKAAIEKVWQRAQSEHWKPIAPLPEIVAAFGASGFFVRLQPEISCEIEGQPHGIQVWATTKPILSNEVLSAGLQFLRATYAGEGFHCRFAVFDSIKLTLFSEKNILSNVSDLLISFEEMLASDWATIVGSSPSPGKEKSPPPPPV